MSEIQHNTTENSVQTEALKFTDENFIWRFSPSQTNPELLEAIFVGRENLLQNVVEKMAESANTASKHHVLLYGPRGIGKTHFISLLKHRIVNNPNINPKVRIAWLNEDETTVSLVQLLVRIYRSLCEAYPDDYSQEWLNDVLDQTPVEIEGMLKRRLVDRFQNQTLIVFVENLNLLLENLGSNGQKGLRSLLQEHPFACLVATSQQLFRAVTDRDEPFFGFFHNIQLKPLSLEDACQLLLNIARSKGQHDLEVFLQSPDGRSRVRAIHHLAGGNHRIYIVLSGFITRESLDHLVVPFQKMADDLTPYYQERLRWISPQQRQIVELLCRERGTMTPKAIARRLLASENTISSQIRKLVEIGYLNVTRQGREAFYELSEPLMRLAYEVKQQSLLVMLIDFLRIWYQLDKMKSLSKDGLSKSTRQYIDAAIERSQTHPDPRIEILQTEIEKAIANRRRHELARMWHEKATVTDTELDWFVAGYCYHEFDKNSSTAIVCYDKALAIEPKFAYAWNNKGNSLNKLNRYEEAITCLDQALSIEPKFAYAWNNKGNSLNSLNRDEEASVCYDKALAIEPEYAYAWNNKGGLLSKIGRYEEAIVCLDKALAIDPEDSYAWNNKGYSLNSLGRYEEAVTCYDKALAIEPTLPSPRFNQSVALFALSRWDEGFESIQVGLIVSDLEMLGNVEPMFAVIFHLSGNDSQLQARVSQLVDIYEEAATSDELSNKLKEDPLVALGEGLVKSLGEIKADRLSSAVLNSYVTAVEQRVARIPQFEVPLRLFRYGIRYLISRKTAELVELIEPEREILRQVLNIHFSEVNLN